MSSGLRGQRVVVGLYCIIVAFTGVAGYLAATVVGEINAPRFLFLIEFPATPLGLAAYGALTIGLILGVLLVSVKVVSDRVDDASPGRDASSTPDPSADELSTDEPPTDEPSTEEPSTDEPPTDEPVDR